MRARCEAQVVTASVATEAPGYDEECATEPWRAPCGECGRRGAEVVYGVWVTRAHGFRRVGSSESGGLAPCLGDAGSVWDDDDSRAQTEGLYGIQALSGIPGCAGATQIQNVGAYGQEVAQTI